ncbi:hypothetical protein [Mesorhizobium sp. B2-4-15]|nr:hypothetical protein [Mesorhizobium sp. B2-4-15]
MIKKPSRMRILVMTYQDDNEKDLVGYSGSLHADRAASNDPKA